MKCYLVGNDFKWWKDEPTAEQLIFEYKDPDVNDIILYKDNYYVVGSINYDNDRALITKVEWDVKANPREWEQYIICPYCGYKDIDSWERSEDKDEIHCGQCNSLIRYERVVTVDYHTYPVRPNEIRIYEEEK